MDGGGGEREVRGKDGPIGGRTAEVFDISWQHPALPACRKGFMEKLSWSPMMKTDPDDGR